MKPHPFRIDGQRRPKPEPLVIRFRELLPEPVVMIDNSDAAWDAYTGETMPMPLTEAELWKP